jgi:hypothetical protein
MKRSIIFAIALVILIGIGAIVYATSDGPGAVDDPLVSRSYVHALVSFSTVELSAGQRLIGGDGTEIILRSGEATAIDNGYNGVANLTAGMDMMTGNSIELNHLLLVPRADGRGILATTEAWVMVRGSYSIL